MARRGRGRMGGRGEEERKGEEGEGDGEDDSRCLPVGICVDLMCWIRGSVLFLQSPNESVWSRVLGIGRGY